MPHTIHSLAIASRPGSATGHDGWGRSLRDRRLLPARPLCHRRSPPHPPLRPCVPVSVCPPSPGTMAGKNSVQVFGRKVCSDSELRSGVLARDAVARCPVMLLLLLWLLCRIYLTLTQFVLCHARPLLMFCQLGFDVVHSVCLACFFFTPSSSPSVEDRRCRCAHQGRWQGHDEGERVPD